MENFGHPSSKTHVLQYSLSNATTETSPMHPNRNAMIEKALLTIIF
jgi:hypothetical protein